MRETRRRPVARRWVIGATVGSALFAAAALLPAPEEIRVSPFDRYGEAVVGGSIPYESFSLEYPPGALPPIVLPALVPNLAYESAFRATQIFLGILLVASTAYLLRDARRAELALGVGVVSALPLLLGSVVVHRFDLFPAVLLTASLVALEHRREGVSGALIGLAAAAKAYAGAVMPPFLGVVDDGRGRRNAHRALGAAIAAAAIVTVPLALVAPGGVASSIFRQTGRDLQVESVGASILLVVGDPQIAFQDGSWSLVGSTARAVGLLSTVAGFVVLLMIWAASLLRRERLGNPALAYAAVVAVVLVFAKVLSPQYLVWLTPLAALVRGRIGLASCSLLGVACVLTQSVYPARYEELLAQETLPVALLVVRNGLLVMVVVLLVAALARRLQGQGVPE